MLPVREEDKEEDEVEEERRKSRNQSRLTVFRTLEKHTFVEKLRQSEEKFILERQKSKDLIQNSGNGSAMFKKALASITGTSRTKSVNLIQDNEDFLWDPPQMLVNMGQDNSYNGALDILKSTGVIEDANKPLVIVPKQIDNARRGRKSSQVTRSSHLFERLRTSLVDLDSFISKNDRYNASVAMDPPPMLQGPIRNNLTLEKRLTIYKERREKSIAWLRRVRRLRNRVGYDFSATMGIREESIGENDCDEFLDCQSQAYNYTYALCFGADSQFEFDLWLHSPQRMSIWKNVFKQTNRTNVSQGSEIIHLTNLGEQEAIEGIELLDETVDQLSLSGSQLHTKGVLALSSVISSESNFRVSVLSLHNTGLEDCHIDILCSALSSVWSLSRLSLSNNKITACSGGSIAELLQRNRSLIELELGWNILKTEGFLKILSGLEHNRSLQYLGVAANLIGSTDSDFGASACSQFINVVEGRVIAHLDISHNDLGLTACDLLCKFVNERSNFLGVHLEGNLDVVVRTDAQGHLFCKKERSETATNCSLVPLLDRPPLFHSNPHFRKGGSLESTCWICDGWHERIFRFTASELTMQPTQELFLHLGTHPDEPISMGLDRRTHTWQSTVLLPPGITYFWLSAKCPVAEEVLTQPESTSDEKLKLVLCDRVATTAEGYHMIRLPVRIGPLIMDGESEQSSWSIENSIFASIGCQGLWNDVRPNYPDDITEVFSVETYLARKGILTDFTSIEPMLQRDWNHVLEEPLISDHFGRHHVLKNTRMEGLNLSLGYHFPGSKDSLEKLFSALEENYVTLSTIRSQFNLDIEALTAALAAKGFSLRPKVRAFLESHKTESFLLLMLCCAEEQYERDVEACDDCIELGLGESLTRFIQQVLKPVLDFPLRDPDKFRREQFYASEIDHILTDKKNSLVRIYESYCHSPEFGMNRDEWLRFIADAKLINTVCTTELVSQIFSFALPLRELHSLIRKKGSFRKKSVTSVPSTIKFPRFLEALARLAAFAAVIPNKKQLQFLECESISEMYEVIPFIDSCIVHDETSPVNLWGLLGQPPANNTMELADRLEQTIEHLIATLVDPKLTSLSSKKMLKRMVLHPKEIFPRSVGGREGKALRTAMVIETFFKLQGKRGTDAWLTRFSF